MISEFDRQGGWSEGFNSCVHWLSWRVGWSPGTARERVRVARALEDLPLLSEALRKGQISYSKVRAATRVARPDNEENLLIMAKDGTAAQLERLVRYYRKYVGDQEQQQAQRQRQKQYLQTYTDDDGMLVVKGRLPPEVGALLQNALDAAADALQQQKRQEERDDDHDDHDECECSVQTPEDLGRSLRVEALGLLAERALAAGLKGERYAEDGLEHGRPAPAPKNLVVVHVDRAVLADPQKAGRSHIEQRTSVPADAPLLHPGGSEGPEDRCVEAPGLRRPGGGGGGGPGGQRVGHGPQDP